MGGITVEDFTKSRAYREIFGEGEARGEAKVTLRLLNRRCGPLDELEALAEALLDFTGPVDLSNWLVQQV